MTKFNELEKTFDGIETLFENERVSIVRENGYCYFNEKIKTGSFDGDVKNLLYQLIIKGQLEKLETPLVFHDSQHVNLAALGLTEIPKNIIVQGYYDLSDNNIKEIPKDFKQEGELDLSNNYITEIPEGYNQNGFPLDLSSNYIKSFPKNFKITGYLCLENTCITEDMLPCMKNTKHRISI